MAATAPGVVAAASAVRDRRTAGRALARLGGLALVAVALAALHVRWRPPTLCPLRALTGLPCPLCGSTTALLELGRGHVLAALRTAPVPLLAGITLLTAPHPVSRVWWRLSSLSRAGLLAAALTTAELWQLARFGWQ